MVAHAYTSSTREAEEGLLGVQDQQELHMSSRTAWTHGETLSQKTTTIKKAKFQRYTGIACINKNAWGFLSLLVSYAWKQS